jgi:hypothetical protein
METEMVKAQLVLLVIASLVAPSPLVSGTGGDGGDSSATLSSFVPSKWDYVIPNETPLAFTGGPDGSLLIPVPHKGGPGFVVEVDGAALAVDVNGDGKVDQRVKGLAGNLVLKGTTESGANLVYGVRFVMFNGKWHFLPGSMMSGKLLGQDVKLIDLNGNGRFDEFGVDGMIFGKGSAASYLSKVVSAGGKLHEITVNAGGTSVSSTPWSGATGTLNLASGFKVDGNLSSAVVLNEKDNCSFELSTYKSGLVVPAGDYKFMYGFVRNGAEVSKIRTGNSKPFPVPANKTTALTWGTPLEIEFTYSVNKDRLSVPTDIHFFGKLGEEYYDFKPEALSPRIVVYDRKTREKLTEGRFGGC